MCVFVVYVRVSVWDQVEACISVFDLISDRIWSQGVFTCVIEVVECSLSSSNYSISQRSHSISSEFQSCAAGDLTLHAVQPFILLGCLNIGTHFRSHATKHCCYCYYCYCYWPTQRTRPNGLSKPGSSEIVWRSPDGHGISTYCILNIS